MSELDVRPVHFPELWPRQKGRWFVLLCFVWLCAVYAAFMLDSHVMNPFERYYLPTYIRTAVPGNAGAPTPITLLNVWGKDAWYVALPGSLPDYHGTLTAGVLPRPIPEGTHFQWVTQTSAATPLHDYLKATFYRNLPLYSFPFPPWSEPSLLFWTGLIVLAFPLTIVGAVFIDIAVTRRLRTGIIINGTRLLTRTTFLRRVVPWGPLSAPWKLGLTFKVGGPPYLGDAFLGLSWLLALWGHKVSTFVRSQSTDRRLPWFFAALMTVSWGLLFYRFGPTILVSSPLPVALYGLLTIAATAMLFPALFTSLARALRPRTLGIPADKETSHLLLMGDTGTGKSSLLRQFLRYIESRDETLVIYDPDGTFASEFYRPERGDVILNPRDSRCPYWQPNSELQDIGEAETLAAGYYPSIQKGSSSEQFFSTAARKILAHLFTHRATAAEIADWLSDPEQLSKLLKNTELKQYVAEYAGQMRGGVEATLSAVVNGLRLLPTENEEPDATSPEAPPVSRRVWSALEWAKARTGWIFITNDTTHRLALQPLISAWLDNILLRLMATKPVGPCPQVWMVMDEVASLNRLPQLEVALAEIRKHKVCMVLGFQGIAQLQERYGNNPTNTILSQPATKVFLRTSENDGAKWISTYLGEQNIEITSKSLNDKTGTTFSKKVDRVPVVPPTTIAHLSNLTGYMTHDNFVTQFTLSYTKGVERHPRLLLRPTAPFVPADTPPGVRANHLPPMLPNPDPQPATSSPTAPPSGSEVPSTQDTPPASSTTSAAVEQHGRWIGALASDWSLETAPLYLDQIDRIRTGFHPVTGQPLSTGAEPPATITLHYGYPVVPPDPSEPVEDAALTALVAHYQSVTADVCKRYPVARYGKWIGVILDQEATRSPDNSSLEIHSEVLLCIPSMATNPASQPPTAPSHSSQSSTIPPVVPPMSKPPAPPSRCTEPRSPSANPPAPAPPIAQCTKPATPAAPPTPAPAAPTSHNSAATPPDPAPPRPSSTPVVPSPGNQDKSTGNTAVTLAQFPGTCPACHKKFPAGTPIILASPGSWTHAHCPADPVNSQKDTPWSPFLRL